MESTLGIDLHSGVLTSSNIYRLVGLWLAYRFVRALYNISPFHPLSRFPGPKLAGMTILYEFWYDMILGGRYTMEIKRMHDVYGPIVRISPDELHCNDISFVDEVYAGAGRKRNKQEHFLKSLAGPTTVSAFGTVDHDLHRIRRNAMNKFFSRAQISKLEPEMKQLVDQLCDKLIRNPTKAPINVTMAYSCFTTDMISAYCFGEPLGFLAQPAWEPNFREAMTAFLNTTFLFRYFPALRATVSIAPKLSKYMGDDIRILMNEMYVNMPARITKAKEDFAAGVVQKRQTVFTDILGSSLPESEKTVFRLSGEGFSLTGAGTETTSWTLSVITYYLLSEPTILARLTKELQSTDPENLSSWSTLEKLPYLYGVVMEGLRLSYGETARSPRVPRDENLTYSGEYGGRKYEYVIPKGTAIGASAVLMHHNKDIFPDSESFIPERWVDETGQRRRELERGMMSFSRGSRQCLGMNLAYCEIYLATAALTLRVFPQMKLFETTIDDIRYDHDLVVAQAKKGSKGVRVAMP